MGICDGVKAEVNGRGLERGTGLAPQRAPDLGPRHMPRGAEHDPRHREAAERPNGIVALHEVGQCRRRVRPLVCQHKELRTDATEDLLESWV